MRRQKMTTEDFDDERRNDDIRRVIRGTMTYEEYAAKWPKHIFWLQPKMPESNA